MMARLHADGLLVLTAATGLGWWLRGRRERQIAAAVTADETLVRGLFAFASEAHGGETAVLKPLPPDWADMPRPADFKASS